MGGVKYYIILLRLAGSPEDKWASFVDSLYHCGLMEVLDGCCGRGWVGERVHVWNREGSRMDKNAGWSRGRVLLLL